MAISLAEVGLLTILTLIIFGAICRLLVINNGIGNLIFLPYPAALIILGMFLGGVSFSFPILNSLALMLELVENVPGMNIFVPAYIFKTIFLLDWLDFLQCWKRVVPLCILVFFGCAFTNGIMCVILCDITYDGISRVLLYGALIGVNDIGDIFTRHGQQKQHKTFFEIEGLIDLVLATFISTHQEHTSNGILIHFSGLHPILLLVINIVLALILGTLFIIFLNYDNCEFHTFICVSIAAGFLLFTAMEIFLDYGIISITIFSMVICPHRRGHDREKDEALNRFWESIYHVANFLVCILVGVLFIRGLVQLNIWLSVGKIVALYFIIVISRMFMVALIFIIAKLFKVNVSWRKAAVYAWGGIRGTSSLGLIFFTFEKEYKLKFQTLGIGMILLNQIINGSTLRALMVGLGLPAPTQVTSLDKVLWCLEEEKATAIQNLHGNSMFADAQWGSIEENTSLRLTLFSRLSSADFDVRGTKLTQSDGSRRPERLEPREMQRLEIQARKRILKTQKVSYTRQHAKELISTEAYKILCAAVELAFHNPLPVIRTSNLQRYWRIDGFKAKIYSSLVKTFLNSDLAENWTTEEHWFLLYTRGVMRQWLIILVVVVQAGFVIFDISSKKHFCSPLSAAINIFFTLYIFVGVIFDMSLFTLQMFKSTFILWTFLDLLMVIDGVLLFAMSSPNADPTLLLALSCVRLFRLIRLFQLYSLIKRTLPWFARVLNNRISESLLLGYDIGKGLVLGHEETLNLLHSLVDNPEVMNLLKRELEMDRLVVYQEIDLLKQQWPIPVVSLKTGQCAQSLIRRMEERTLELSSSGLLDEDEESRVLKELAEQRRRLRHQLKAVQLQSGREIFSKIPWLRADSSAVVMLATQAVPWKMNAGRIVIQSGDAPEGLLILRSGLLRCEYIPNEERLQQLQHIGALPNFDTPRHLNYSEPQVEVAWEGTVIGEIGILTDRRHDVDVYCESNVLLMFVSMRALRPIFHQLEMNMWLAIGRRIATILLMGATGFETWTRERIKARLEDSLMPDLTDAYTLELGETAETVFLIEGMVFDPDNKIYHTAPCIIQPNPKLLLLPFGDTPGFPDAVPIPRILVLPQLNAEDMAMKKTTNKVEEIVENVNQM